MPDDCEVLPCEWELLAGAWERLPPWLIAFSIDDEPVVTGVADDVAGEVLPGAPAGDGMVLRGLLGEDGALGSD